MSLGTYASARVNAGGAKTIDYVTELDNGANLTTYTFTAADIGVADADRTVLIMVGGRVAGTTAFTISSVTVGGNPATEVIQATNNAANSNTMGVYAIDVAAGTTADVVATFSRTAVRAAIAIYRCTGISTTANSTHIDNNTFSPFTLSVTATTGGFAVAGVFVGGTPSTVAFTGAIVSDFNKQIGAETSWWAGGHVAANGSIDGGGTSTDTTDIVAVAAAW